MQVQIGIKLTNKYNKRGNLHRSVLIVFYGILSKIQSAFSKKTKIHIYNKSREKLSDTNFVKLLLLCDKLYCLCPFLHSPHPQFKTEVSFLRMVNPFMFVQDYSPFIFLWDFASLFVPSLSKLLTIYSPKSLSLTTLICLYHFHLKKK